MNTECLEENYHWGSIDKRFKEKNLIQGYNLSHEEVSKFYDQIEFWISASEESYMDVKYVHISKPSKSARENRKK